MRILRQKKYWIDHAFEEKYEAIREKIRTTFSGLIFKEDTHQYFYNGRELTCVSNVTHQFQEHFDADEKAQGVYERQYNDPTAKYYHMTVEEIKQAWVDNSRNACEFGTEVHEFSENLTYFSLGQFDKITPKFKDRLIEDENGYGFVANNPHEEAAVRYFEDLPECYIPIMPETQIFVINDKYSYSGTFDLLVYYDATILGLPESKSGLVVMDWKTNKDLYKNFKDKRLLEPFSELPDMPLNLYKLQLSLYELALIKIGLKVVGRRLMWLLPSGNYEKVALESFSKKLDNWLLLH